VIAVVRHGRTDANAKGLLLGRLDVPLDDEGRRQAARVAVEVAALDVVRVVTSPLARTRATAYAVATALRADGRPVEVQVDDRWIELDYGVLDGTPLADVGAERWAAWRSDVAWAPDGGESLVELGARVRSACDDLVHEAVGHDVVVVTHVSPIKAAAAWALGVGDEVAWRMFVAPASITRIGLTPSAAGPSPSLRSFNEVGHLA
jgi:broad specificity phosphatase PhoE